MPKKKKNNTEDSNKNDSFDPTTLQELFSPVSSPVVLKPSQGNLTGSERVAKDSAADIYNATLKWDDLNLSGAAIMRDIANLKLRSLFEPSTTASMNVSSFPLSSSVSSSISTTIPQEIEPLCEKLLKIVEAMEKVVDKLESLCNVYRGLFNLEDHRYQRGETTETVPFQSWSYKDFEMTVKKIVESYQTELELKKTVIAEVAHVPDRNLLMFCTASWLHQPYITGETQLLLEALVTETGLK
ncbi:cyclin-dependent kinase 2-interacting protein-like [Argonauta hians]